MAALKACNQHKNRNFDYLPIESARASLTPQPGMDGSDYINASWMPGFNRQREFIITQHPLEQTVVDFWRMLWDHNVRTAVVLSPVQHPEFGVFWPGTQVNIETDVLRVSLADESEANGYQVKDFSLASSNQEFELSVRLVFCPSWPHICTPLSTSTEFVNLVQNIHIQRGGGPLVVVDRFGGTEAAFYCAVSSMVRQLDYENHVDVYEFAKVSHARRPGIWRTQEDYFHLYRIMVSVGAIVICPFICTRTYLSIFIINSSVGKCLLMMVTELSTGFHLLLGRHQPVRAQRRRLQPGERPVPAAGLLHDRQHRAALPLVLQRARQHQRHQRRRVQRIHDDVHTGADELCRSRRRGVQSQLPFDAPAATLLKKKDISTNDLHIQETILTSKSGVSVI